MTKHQFRILIVLTVVAGFLGGGVSNLLLRGGPAAAYPVGAQATTVVRATQFVLVNGAGKTQATLSSGTAGPTLTMLDATGHARVALRVLANGTPDLSLSDAAGKARTEVGFIQGINPAYPYNYPVMITFDASGTGRLALGLLPDGIAGGNPELQATRTDGTTAVKVGELSPADVKMNLGLGSILGTGLYTRWQSQGGGPPFISGNGGMECPNLTDKP